MGSRDRRSTRLNTIKNVRPPQATTTSDVQSPIAGKMVCDRGPDVASPDDCGCQRDSFPS
jgi:hypothetical protein